MLLLLLSVIPVVVGFQFGQVALLVLIGHGNIGSLLIIIGLLPHLSYLQHFL